MASKTVYIDYIYSVFGALIAPSHYSLLLNGKEQHKHPAKHLFLCVTEEKNETH